MGYLRPVQAVSRPHSFPIASGVTFERGAFLWLDTAGKVTNVRGGSDIKLGLADDDNLESTTGKATLQQLSSTATLASSGGQLTFVTGRKISSTATAGTPPADWTLEYNNAGTWTEIDMASSTVTLQAAGSIIIDLVATVPATSTTYRLTATYTYVREQVGAEVVSDMFNNYSSMATDAVGRLCTVWFMDGVYETDQYDPLATTAYTIGAIAYAKTGGLLTPVSSSADAVGNILAVPAANYTAETKTTSGHSKPRPETLRVLLRLPRAA